MNAAHPLAEEAPLPKESGDDIAVASFVLGLLGLFFFNIALGPLALALGGVSLARGTGRRGRALLGMALGVADLVVLVALVAAHHGGFTWGTAA
ncbi:DUF4190 domain-containing protein [Streptacidiphilus sp. PB12-B1b]|uniref:DUF4190 domain-containing protein n=1 Tax=Streptacidiphilus sp. PB12-B1b TaxID=2705012 RepID=UPI0015F8F1AB|nr:DUF4190 domain-containing protein [Streptacidiphilus sp. PB12-B1b]QMU76129.1 DUF4190 domain-containing protein [Streptacidiphilus sp. PB12-B1b]